MCVCVCGIQMGMKIYDFSWIYDIFEWCSVVFGVVWMLWRFLSDDWGVCMIFCCILTSNIIIKNEAGRWQLMMFGWFGDVFWIPDVFAWFSVEFGYLEFAVVCACMMVCCILTSTETLRHAADIMNIPSLAHEISKIVHNLVCRKSDKVSDTRDKVSDTFRRKFSEQFHITLLLKRREGLCHFQRQCFLTEMHPILISKEWHGLWHMPLSYFYNEPNNVEK